MTTSPMRAKKSRSHSGMSASEQGERGAGDRNHGDEKQDERRHEFSLGRTSDLMSA